ncbi:MAG: hypothetical protein KDD84_22815, partial [Caldilineaceae bacterium]|nr:hypothetical protein [Caldilineaceae bacterium]
MKRSNQFSRASRTRPTWLGWIVAVTAMLAVAWLMGVNGAAPALAQEGTTITVDTSADLVPGSLTHTCTYTEGAFFFPAADGNCTLRRALREASAR